ncbi:MAG: HAD-IA family hydrolase [Actinomycetota bacterium]|jgi:2-haloacid dehalogenase|nr:HAD-IA family hydrolase [Actinomycetota bacterium]
MSNMTASEAPELAQVRALAFDVGGTVFDWQGATQAAVGELAVARSADIDVAAFCLEWRRDMFAQLARVRRGQADPMNADGLHRFALDSLGERYPTLQLTDADKDSLVEAWHSMDSWPDFRPALARLRTRFSVVVLTVMSWSIAVDCSKRNDLHWDGILSCELLGAYKPDPPAYEAGARVLRLEPNQMMMVASHPADLRAAMDVGYRSAFVTARHDEPGGTDDGNPEDFDILADDFTGLADQLVR